MAFIPLVITVAMGMMAGGMVALALIGPRQTQTLYVVLAALGVLLGVGAVAAGPDTAASTYVYDSFNLLLSAFLGYAVTTFFVLSYQVTPDRVLPDPAAIAAAQAGGAEKTAVLYYVPAEPEHYNARVAARGFETADYPQALPPLLARPFALQALKRKYAAIRQNTYRTVHFRLAQKVQERLGKRYRVYVAFYNDAPSLADAASEALRAGAQRLIVLHPRLTDPPPALHVRDLLAPLRLARYGVSVRETAPLWSSELLPRLIVRRALAATDDQDRATAGLLLIGQGHPAPHRYQPKPGVSTVPDPLERQHQEMAFVKRVRQALIKAGFAEDNVVLTWWQWQEPPPAAGLAQLAAAGCRHVFWLPVGMLTDCIATLHDIPAALQAAVPAGVELRRLGPWNDDDLLAEALAEKVKQVVASEQLV